MIQYIGIVHACRGFQELVHMKVNHDGGILVNRFTRRPDNDPSVVGLCLLHHLLLELFGIHVDTHCHPVILHDGHDERRLFEEIVLLESMKFIELHSIHTQLNPYGLFQQERFFALIGKQLTMDTRSIWLSDSRPNSSINNLVLGSTSPVERRVQAFPSATM